MDALGLIIEKGRSKEIEQALITEAFKINNQGKKLITIIDEAHLLDLDVLRKLRLLFDGFPKNHNLILFAQPDLLGRLAMNVYSDIKTRITYSAKLLPLEQDDMQKYIFREIGEAELPANIFDENAIGLITRSCEGNLRLCRNLCYASLVECAHLKQKSISIDIVNRVLIQPHWRKHSEDV
jgi:type II secretory pathway predicted ATPase ExeA